MAPEVIDHLLVIGFGGPTRPDEIRPFLAQVSRGARIPESRIQEVMHHYEAVGGRSPYNEYTIRLVTKVEQALRARGVRQPLFFGMRNWCPWLRDVLADIHRQGLTHGLGLVLVPHRSPASFEKYVRSVEEAQASVPERRPHYEYLASWHTDPLFLEAQADHVRKAFARLAPEVRRSTHLIFSAHSIPRSMADGCHYAEEFAESSRGVAEALGHAQWSVAYQSRSGHPHDPWLEPDVASVIRRLAGQGVRQVMLVPIGFLCDNVEVLFDLDIEARHAAQEVGVGYARASTVMDHPAFVELLARRLSARLRDA